MKSRNTGENNPNFGKKWSEKNKIKASETRKSVLENNDELRYRLGNSNRGKKFSKELIQKMHSGRTPDSYSKPHTEKSKALIGIKSREKFTEEYKESQRAKMEEMGYWRPLSEIESYEIYFKECNWTERMFDLVPDENNLLKENGVFNNKNNTKGVVRDHILGRKKGFSDGIFPEIIRHPCNCQLILHRDNVAKAQRGKGRPDSSMEIGELFEKIINYENEWHEQEKCLELIKRYNNGERWQR